MQHQHKPQKDDGGPDTAGWFGFGIEFCGVLAVFCYMGYKLDQRWDTSPWCLIAGFFTGFAGMLYTIIKRIWNIRQK